jgi:hypothetical protein
MYKGGGTKRQLRLCLGLGHLRFHQEGVGKTSPFRFFGTGESVSSRFFVLST